MDTVDIPSVIHRYIPYTSVPAKTTHILNKNLQKLFQDNFVQFCPVNPNPSKYYINMLDPNCINLMNVCTTTHVFKFFFFSFPGMKCLFIYNLQLFFSFSGTNTYVSIHLQLTKKFFLVSFS